MDKIKFHVRILEGIRRIDNCRYIDFEIAIISLFYDVISISHINITMTVDMTQIYHIHFISNHLRSFMPKTIVDIL